MEYVLKWFSLHISVLRLKRCHRIDQKLTLIRSFFSDVAHLADKSKYVFLFLFAAGQVWIRISMNSVSVLCDNRIGLRRNIFSCQSCLRQIRFISNPVLVMLTWISLMPNRAPKTQLFGCLSRNEFSMKCGVSTW